MIRLTTISLLFFISCSAEPDPRSPRIYNVLISSKKNLSPSHAQPVYEPVLTTTSIGYAIPFFYHTSFIQNLPASYINPSYTIETKIDGPLVNPNDNLLPIPYANQNRGNNNPPPSPVPMQTNELNKEQNQKRDDTDQAKLEYFIPQVNPHALNFVKYLPKKQESDTGSQNPHPATHVESDTKNVVVNHPNQNPNVRDVIPPRPPVRVSENL